MVPFARVLMKARLNAQRVMSASGPQKGGRIRGIVSVVLIVAATLTAIAGGLTLYVREEIIDSSAFADRGVDAITQPALKTVVAREITVQLIEPGVPDLLAARPVMESAVQIALGSGVLRPAIHVAVENGHRLLFHRSSTNAVFDLADAGTVVTSALQTLAPKIASEIPSRTDAVLLTLRRRAFATATLRFADTVRVLGLVLLPIGVLLFALAIWIAPSRRRALTRSGVAIGLTGIAAVIALLLVRRYVVTHVYGADELSNGDVRSAVGELWAAYINDLMTWLIVCAIAGWVLAVLSAPLVAPYSATDGLRRAGRLLSTRVLSGRASAVRGGLLGVLGLLVIFKPGVAVDVVVFLCGAVLLYIGVGELLTATPAERRRLRLHLRAPRRLVAVAAGVATFAAVIGVAVALTGGASNVRAGTIATCNGYAQLCDRRLDQVVFAGTHNSMSAADSPGWLIANQDRDLAQQLDDGLRVFKISTHYAIADSAGGVHTDIAAEGQRLNRVASKLAPAARAALQRLSAALGRGSLSRRKRDIWLCHTLCELGATRMVDFLSVLRRFIERNPNQVVILFDEDYVSERDLRGAFKRAGLFRYLATLQKNQPLPTLGQLIEAHHNVLVFAQKPVSDRYPWNADGFTWIQDTPLGATEARPVHMRAVPWALEQPVADDERLGRHLPAATRPQRASRPEGLHPRARTPMRGRAREGPKPDPDRLLQPRRGRASSRRAQRRGRREGSRNRSRQLSRGSRLNLAFRADLPSVAMDGGGNIVAAWETLPVGGTPTAIQGARRLIGPSGFTGLPNFSGDASNDNGSPLIVTNASENGLVVWVHTMPPMATQEIELRTIGSGGAVGAPQHFGPKHKTHK